MVDEEFAEKAQILAIQLFSSAHYSALSGCTYRLFSPVNFPESVASLLIYPAPGR